MLSLLYLLHEIFGAHVSSFSDTSHLFTFPLTPVPSLNQNLLNYSWYYRYQNADGGNFHFLTLLLITHSAFVSEVSSAVLVKVEAWLWFSRLTQLFSLTGLALLPFASTQHPFLLSFSLLHKDFSMTPSYSLSLPFVMLQPLPWQPARKSTLPRIPIHMDELFHSACASGWWPFFFLSFFLPSLLALFLLVSLEAPPSTTGLQHSIAVPTGMGKDTASWSLLQDGPFKVDVRTSSFNMLPPASRTSIEWWTSPTNTFYSTWLSAQVQTEVFKGCHKQGFSLIVRIQKQVCAVLAWQQSVWQPGRQVPGPCCDKGPP